MTIDEQITALLEAKELVIEAKELVMSVVPDLRINDQSQSTLISKSN